MKLGHLAASGVATVAPRAIAIGGHRGCGENLLSLRSAPCVEPAYRENTLRSFQRAVDLGCSFVEFDVQVTSDGVPVLWHDNQVVTGAYDEDQGMAPSRSIREIREVTLAELQTLVYWPEEEEATNMIRHTPLHRKFRCKETRVETPGFVPWLCRKDDAVPCLSQLFKTLPEHVGFDIEVKMAMPDNVEATPAEEIDRMLTPILKCVEENATNSNRTIVFTSFDPDVCLELARRQSRYPVMFLSGCGLYKHVDPRRTSIPAALQLAAENKLSGIVVPASILLASPQMASQAFERGLQLLTYGLDNDDLDAIVQQYELGVNAVIVDDVEGMMAHFNWQSQRQPSTQHALQAVAV